MKLSREAQRYAHQLFDLALDQGSLNPQVVLGIADLLLQNPPRHAFQILQEFTRLVRLELEKHHAHIESALPLEGSFYEEILSLLKKRDPQLTVSTEVNPNLIGGLKIRLGSDVWDDTLLYRLESLRTL